jgi:hypothetical protein
MATRGSENPATEPQRLLHWTDTGARLSHAIVSFMPLAIGPQAVRWAVSVASAGVLPAAVAQLDRPSNSMQTVHSWFARAVDI